MRFGTCEEVEPLLCVHVDGELTTPERALVDQHIASCHSCQEAKDEFRAVGNVLRRHFAWRAASDVTAGVIRELEDEVTLASLPVPTSESIDEMKGRIKSLRGPQGVVPNDRADAVTNVTPARPAAPHPPGTPEVPRDGSRSLVGTTLGGYRIDAEIAKGGMGVVYRAVQLSLDRVVALKVLSNRLAQDETFKKRFIREAKAAATIDHQNVIRVFDAGEDKGETFFAMEFVPGDDAETIVLKTGPIEVRRAAEIGLAVAHALEAAHERGIVHRDVKPANVLIAQRGGIKLADLGLAKLEDTGNGDGQLTLRKTVMGSPNYMSPEQAGDARDTDARSDVYSLGATLYHIVAGERPWGGGSSMDIMARVLGPIPLALPELAADESEIDPVMRAIVAKACLKEREQRYQTMAALSADLEAFLKGEPVAAMGGKRSKGRTSATLPAIDGKRRRPTSDSARRTVEAGPSGRSRAEPRPSSSTSRALVILAAFSAVGIAALVLKKAAFPDPSPPENVADDGRRPTDVETPLPPRPTPTPTAQMTSRTTLVSPSPRVDEGETLAYQDAVQQSDHSFQLEHWGEAAQALERFAQRRPSSDLGKKAQRDATAIHEKIDQRLKKTLDDAKQLEEKRDWKGAEDLLREVDSWGDEAAKGRANDEIQSLPAAKSVQGPVVQERPSPPPEVAPPLPDPAATPVAKPSPKAIDPAAQASPSPAAPLTGDELFALAKGIKGKLDFEKDGRAHLFYDFQAANQAEDWVAATLEPAWLREAFEALPSAPAPGYETQAPWTINKSAFFATGWRRRRSVVAFTGDSLKIEIQAKLLAGRNLVVSIGDPGAPLIVGCGLHLSDSVGPKEVGRPKDELAVLATIHKSWKDFNHPAVVVARERAPFEWSVRGVPVPLKDLSTKGTHFTIELKRDEDGDSVIARCDGERPARVALGKGTFTAGPIGLEVLGRPVAFDSIMIEGTLDPVWGRQALAGKK